MLWISNAILLDKSYYFIQWTNKKYFIILMEIGQKLPKGSFESILQ